MVKYAPRKVYIRESGGYVELSYTEFCRCRESDQTYMDKLFIPIQGCLLEVVREQYTDFYRDKERWRYLQKLDTMADEDCTSYTVSDDYCKTERKGIVLSLCPRCRSEFQSIPENIVKRLDPFQADKEMCDKCQVGYGYDYMIFKKNHHHAKGGVDNV